MRVRFLIVDGFNLVRRIYEAGQGAEASILETVSAARASLGRALNTYAPTHAAVIFEEQGRTWRHLLYPAYKENRSPTPEAMLNGLPLLREAFLAEGVVTTSVDSYESDDVIATLATAVGTRDGQVTILSTDRVFLQLLAPGLRIIDHFSGTRFDEAHVKAGFGVAAEQFVDYLSLVGNKSNNIPGVAGVGPKTATRLLARYPSLDRMLSADPETLPGGIKKGLLRVQGARETALLCRQLLTLKTNVAIGDNLRHFRLVPRER